MIFEDVQRLARQYAVHKLDIPKLDNKAWVKFIVGVIPSLLLIMRDEAADYYNCTADRDKLSQEKIYAFLLKYYEFDVIEISHLVAALRKAFGDAASFNK